jgi:hypothetical protein
VSTRKLRAQQYRTIFEVASGDFIAVYASKRRDAEKVKNNLDVIQLECLHLFLEVPDSSLII